MSYINKGKISTLKKKTPKTPSNTQRAISANYNSSHNNLPKMLKDYQQFCQKYFGNTTPIASMDPEKIDKIFGEEENNKEEPKKPEISKETKNKLSLTMLDNDTFDFSYNSLDIPKSLAKITDSDFLEYSNEQKIGFGKNDKMDYIKRLKKIQAKPSADDQLKEEEEEENYEEDFNFQEKEEVHDQAHLHIEQESENKEQNTDNEQEKNNDEQKQPLQIFDDDTHNLINEETKNRQASKIQLCFKNQKCTKRLRDRIYFGDDKTHKYLLWIYIDKKSPKDAKENFDIISLFVKTYCIKTKAFTYEKKMIKDIFFDNSINSNQIKAAIPDIIEKLLKQDKDEDGNNSFEELHSEKGEIKDEIHQSLSSIENVDYDNI